MERRAHVLAAKVMKDKPQALAAGLKTIGTARPAGLPRECPRQALRLPNGRQDNCPSYAPPVVAERAVRYKTPINLAIRPDGKEIYVTCEASSSVCA